MAILVDENTRVLVQGITGRVGRVQTKLMIDYGTKIVCGVTPGKGGTELHGLPVYDTVEEALMKHDVNCSVIFVPAPNVKDAAFEAIDAGIQLIVIITEGVPVHDSMKIKAFAERKGAIVIGPNTPGIISPGKSKVGILPGNLFKFGEVGIVARSGTLATEIAGNLSEAGVGQSTCVGIGGDMVTGITFVDILKMFEEDNETKKIVIVGEIGRTVEEEAAAYIRKKVSKPVFAFIAGKSAPPEKRMGHAGAIIGGEKETAQTKIKVLREAGVKVVEVPFEIVETLKST